MHKRTKIIAIIILSIFTLCSFADKQGIKYYFDKINSSNVHIIVFDPKQYDLTPILANKVRGRKKESVQKIARTVDSVVAINGSFFNLNGSSTWALKISGQWLGISYQLSPSLGWDHKGNFLFDYIDTKTKILSENATLKINTMNKNKIKSKPILFSEPLDKKDTSSHLPCCYIAFKDNKIISYSHSPLNIPDGGYIYYSTTQSLCEQENIQDMQYMKLDISAVGKNSHRWNKLPFIMAGFPMLVMDNKVIAKPKITSKARRAFLEGRHGRTAIGMLDNGNIMLIVVEEDPFEAQSGIDLETLAKYMHEKGCVHALNLDGGSSASMYINKDLAKGRNQSIGYASYNFVSNALVLHKKP